MSSDLKYIGQKLIHVVALMVLISLPIWVIRYDVLVLKNNIPEQSATEYMEQCLLFATMLCYGYIGYQSKQYRKTFYLISAFFTCMLIRELDSFFDQMVHHGFWVIPALVVAFSAISYALSDRKNTVINLKQFMGNKHFPVLALGLAILFVFSRLLGMGSFWHQIMGDAFIRVVKNIAEESTELLGYTIIFYASVNYLFFYLNTLSNKQSCHRNNTIIKS
ncbi:hypothetical protein [Photobacterium leiognathi]|uniref:hypothetical protein n=1 Tax=Photobacterium leiognathi TaxID=553611 RepID=UPI002980ABD4|nr:hypothetical protein [Photobacterium leiognathi]